KARLECGDRVGGDEVARHGLGGAVIAKRAALVTTRAPADLTSWIEGERAAEREGGVVLGFFAVAAGVLGRAHEDLVAGVEAARGAERDVALDAVDGAA